MLAFSNVAEQGIGSRGHALAVGPNLAKCQIRRFYLGVTLYHLPLTWFLTRCDLENPDLHSLRTVWYFNKCNTP
jgi:hypothetical protein